MNEMHLTHEELIDYLHGELTPARDAAAHAHLATCSACSRAHEAEASLTEVLQRHARSEERDLPPSVVAAIREATSQQRATPAWEMLRGIFRPAIAVPMAAAIAAALYFGIDVSHKSSPETSINAAYYVNNHAALTATAPFSEDPVPAVLTSDDTAAQQPADAPR